MKISKRPKRDTRTPPGEDWISSLPDSLLHHILSLLGFKEVVATSALAKRWRFLWRSVPVVELRSHEREDSNIPMLISQTLEQYEGLKIREFYVHFCYGDLTHHQVDFWVQFATERNVELFDLNLLDFEISNDDDEETVYYMLPCLLDCQSLKVLRLSCCDLNLHSSLNLSFLKELDLYHVRLSVLNTSGCPVLETLILHYCVTPPECVICAPSEHLRYLKIWEDTGVTNCDSAATIFAPNLQCIHFSGYIRRSYNITNVSSLRSAKLDFEGMYAEDLSKDTASLLMLLEYLSHASYIRLCLWCIQALSFGEIQGWRCPPFKARRLKLQSNLGKYELGGMAAALRGCCYLESLIVDTTDSQGMFSVGESNETWEILNDSLATSSLRLRYVKIKNFLESGIESLFCFRVPEDINGYLENWAREFQFVELLLNRCVLLEMMTISTTKMIPLAPELIIAITKRLLNLPKASTNARICFS